MNTKIEQRKRAKAVLSTIEKEYVQNASNIIASKLFSLDEYKNAKIIFAYQAFDSEVRTQSIVDKALSDGKRVAVPKIIGDKMLSIDIQTVNNWSYNDYGIKEPVDGDEVEPDLVIMPLLAFDDFKSRLGRGKGYYDRYCNARNIKSIAIAFDLQKFDRIAKDENDFIPSMIVTEKEIIR